MIRRECMDCGTEYTAEPNDAWFTPLCDDCLSGQETIHEPVSDESYRRAMIEAGRGRLLR